MLGLEVSLGRDMTIDFDDVLNGPPPRVRARARPRSLVRATDPSEPEAIGSVFAMTEASPLFK